MLKDFYIPLYDMYTPENYEKAILSSEYVSIALESNKVVGALRVISDNVRFALLVDFVVDENRQREGIGSNIMKETIKFLKEKRIHSITLNTDPKHEWLEGFYSEFGFVESNGVYMIYNWQK